MDKWGCEECNNLDPCVLFVPSDHGLTATTCPYSGTDCNWYMMTMNDDTYDEETKKIHG